MIKTVGILFILISTSVMGLLMYTDTRQKQAQQEKLYLMIHSLHRTLSSNWTPLPQLLKELGEGQSIGVEGLFTRIAQLLEQSGGCTLAYAFTTAIDATPQLNLSAHSQQILIRLSKEFGKLSQEACCSFLEQTEMQLDEERQIIRVYAREKVKSMITITICTGLAMAVVLM